MQLAKGTENTEEKPVQKPEVSTEAPPTNDETQATEYSLRSKLFRLVSEQKKTVEKGFSVLIARLNETRTEKWKRGEGEGEGEGEGKEGRNA